MITLVKRQAISPYAYHVLDNGVETDLIIFSNNLSDEQCTRIRDKKYETLAGFMTDNQFSYPDKHDRGAVRSWSALQKRLVALDHLPHKQ